MKFGWGEGESSWHICRLLRAQRMSVRLDAPSRWHIPALCNSGETGAFFIARFGEYAGRTCRRSLSGDITFCRDARGCCRPSTPLLNDARLLCKLQYTMYPSCTNLLNWHQLRLRLRLYRDTQLCNFGMQRVEGRARIWDIFFVEGPRKLIIPHT